MRSLAASMITTPAMPIQSRARTRSPRSTIASTRWRRRRRGPKIWSRWSGSWSRGCARPTPRRTLAHRRRWPLSIARSERIWRNSGPSRRAPTGGRSLVSGSCRAFWRAWSRALRGSRASWRMTSTANCGRRAERRARESAPRCRASIVAGRRRVAACGTSPNRRGRRRPFVSAADRRGLPDRARRGRAATGARSARAGADDRAQDQSRGQRPYRCCAPRRAGGAGGKPRGGGGRPGGKAAAGAKEPLAARGVQSAMGFYATHKRTLLLGVAIAVAATLAVRAVGVRTPFFLQRSELGGQAVKTAKIELRRSNRPTRGREQAGQPGDRPRADRFDTIAGQAGNSRTSEGERAGSGRTPGRDPARDLPDPPRRRRRRRAGGAIRACGAPVRRPRAAQGSTGGGPLV